MLKKYRNQLRTCSGSKFIRLSRQLWKAYPLLFIRLGLYKDIDNRAKRLIEHKKIFKIKHKVYDIESAHI